MKVNFLTIAKIQFFKEIKLVFREMKNISFFRIWKRLVRYILLQVPQYIVSKLAEITDVSIFMKLLLAYNEKIVIKTGNQIKVVVSSRKWFTY